ncbi:glycine--tRNA ligase subunit beta [Alcaligenaceae bacterium CGII-47]|nr:glycine--tRNA ligase subunit beta [Alcaligenaceae bacterium CGII-47]
MHTEIRPLILELVTEELPPKALDALGRAFAAGTREVLERLDLLDNALCITTDYATPRRLAVHLSHVRGHAPDQAYSEKLMPAHIGLTKTGDISAALAKKLSAKNLSHLSAADLVHRSDGKQDILYAEGWAAGSTLTAGLQAALDHALTCLPIPKVMQYQLADGQTSVKFVRPAHRLLALWGTEVIPVSTLGLTASRETSGHRFMGQATLSITSADTWLTQLREQGMVIPAFAERRTEIARQLAEHATALGATIGDSPEVVALLDEVTALVEHPSVYAGAFDAAFLSVPPECLILTMRLNQKYFPLFDLHEGAAGGALTHRFLIVSNMRPENPRQIIEGNERVVRPRLADAQFFFQTDLKVRLADRVEGLAHSVYHNKLGSQLERIGRMRQIATWLAQALGAAASDADKDIITHADRAALLAKADLGTNMVGEFPELQGIMGAYYAAADAEHPSVAQALRDQYRVRLDTAITAQTLTSAILFMAERAETLIGIWGIGLAPTGERDPYGLRRAALGLICAYEQLTAGGYLSVSEDSPARLSALLTQAAATFKAGILAPDTVDAVRAFVYERYRNQLNTELAEHPFGRQSVDAVLALQPPLHQVRARVEACANFAARPEAQNLAAANKRVSNLLKKSTGAPGRVQGDPAGAGFDPALAVEPAEQVLYATITRLAPIALAQAQTGDFAASLSTLAQAREPVDSFFKDVMVMAEDPTLRTNRIALLHALHQLMNQVADISRLA